MALAVLNIEASQAAAVGESGWDGGCLQRMAHAVPPRGVERLQRAPAVEAAQGFHAHLVAGDPVDDGLQRDLGAVDTVPAERSRSTSTRSRSARLASYRASFTRARTAPASVSGSHGATPAEDV